MKNLDLNLLPQLQVLLELRNVSRTAERLQLSQPAASAAMARLRRHFDDELLVRNGRTYDLTPFAQALVPLVDEAMLHIQRATRVRSGFDATTSEREFVIAASDYAAALIVGPLRQILRKEAPNVSVDFISTSGSGIQGQMADYSRIDLLVGPTGYQMRGAAQQLFRDIFVAVLDAGSPLLQQPALTLEDLVTVPHAVAYFGEGISTPVDKLFEGPGITRRVAAVVAGFLSLPLLVEGTDLVALVPRMLASRAQRGADIAVLEFAEETSLVEAMYWHPSQSEDPASVWLRSVVQRSCSRLHELLPVTAHPVTIGGTDTK